MFKFILNLFKTKDFAAKQADIISSFSKAIEEANKLEAEIALHVDAKAKAIADMQKEIDVAKATNEKNSKFITNLSKIIE